IGRNLGAANPTAIRKAIEVISWLDRQVHIAQGDAVRIFELCRLGMRKREQHAAKQRHLFTKPQAIPGFQWQSSSMRSGINWAKVILQARQRNPGPATWLERATVARVGIRFPTTQVKNEALRRGR